MFLPEWFSRISLFVTSLLFACRICPYPHGLQRLARRPVQHTASSSLALKHALDAAAFQYGFEQIHLDDTAGSK
jgi:hypothetical protein